MTKKTGKKERKKEKKKERKKERKKEKAKPLYLKKCFFFLRKGLHNHNSLGLRHGLFLNSPSSLLRHSRSV